MFFHAQPSSGELGSSRLPTSSKDAAAAQTLLEFLEHCLQSPFILVTCFSLATLYLGPRIVLSGLINQLIHWTWLQLNYGCFQKIKSALEEQRFACLKDLQALRDGVFWKAMMASLGDSSGKTRSPR